MAAVATVWYQRERERERQRQTGTQTERERERERQTDRQTDTDKQTDTNRQTNTQKKLLFFFKGQRKIDFRLSIAVPQCRYSSWRPSDSEASHKTSVETPTKGPAHPFQVTLIVEGKKGTVHLQFPHPQRPHKAHDSRTYTGTGSRLLLSLSPSAT